MSDTLVYSAWSKDIDPLFATEKSMLYPTPTDIYSDRRMSDSTTSESNSPATEPDLSLDPVRKPSLPGFDQLLEPVEPYGRRPSMISDLSLSNRRPQPLSSYSFPAIGLESAPTTSTASAGASPYSVSSHPESSPQFSPMSWNSPVLHNDIHQHNHLQQHHPHHPHPHHPHHLHQQHPMTHDHQSVSPPASLLHSPKRRRSPMTPPSNSGSPQPISSAPTVVPPTATGPVISTPEQSQPVRRPRGKLPKHTTDLLKEWLHAHSDHPYPSEDEKRDLCNRTKLSMSQVSNWMINARRRILAPASKAQAAVSASSDAYRSMPRQIGSMYPSHMYAPQHHTPSGLLRRQTPQDTLRLYDTPYYDPPRYQTQSHPPLPYSQDRRLSYPTSVSYSHSPPISEFHSSYSQYNTSRDPTAPRYFTAPTDTL